MNYKELCNEFWKVAKALSYINTTGFGVEDIIITSFYARTKEEWIQEGKKLINKYLALAEDETYENELESLGEYSGEGEYVLEVWGEYRLYKIDEQAIEDLKSNVDLKYVYLKNNGNLSYCKTKNNGKELLSVFQFNLMTNKANWNVEFMELKEGIYELTEDKYCKQYKKVS